MRPSDVTVSVLRVGAPDCTGHTFPGTAIWYMPQPGFRGVDQFTYDIVGRTDALHRDTAVIDVR